MRVAGMSVNAMSAAERAQSLFARAAEAEQTGAWAEVDRCYREASALVVPNANLVGRHAIAVFNAGDTARAATMTRRALRLTPGDAGLELQLGKIYFDQKRIAEARDAFRRAFALDPDNAEILRRLAHTLQNDAETRGEAEQLLLRAVELAPADLLGWLQLGAIYSNEDSRFDEAERVFARALEISPDAPSALHNYGLLKRFKGELDLALTYLTRACEVRPADPGFAFSLATCYLFMEDLENALKWCLRAAELDSGYNPAKVYIAFTLFHMGRYAEAWQQYETRLQLKELQDIKFHRPRWDGSPLNGETLLLMAEQGMGDNLQFVRYAECAAQRGGKVIVITHHALHRLFQSLKGVTAVVTGVPEPKYFHRYSPLMSLPLVFGTEPADIPQNVPYLAPPADLAAQWGERIGGHAGPRIGLSWRGNPRHVNDRFRSSNAADMAALAAVRPDARFYSLHTDLTEAERAILQAAGVADLGHDFTDFADTAAAMQHLDLVITVDTSVCHLAGALGRPVWTMLARGPDFRWGIRGETTPWYPTMRLYRQHKLGVWADVYARMKTDLAAL
jgi:tetratricopeptide (TPR) repeat protein